MSEDICLAKRCRSGWCIRRREVPEHDDWPSPADPSLIVERSIATDDPHAFKFVEASVREYRLNPQPVYLAAAED
jgi:hypothetical protein